MDVFPKFIVQSDTEEGDFLIIAKCTFHKQLAILGEEVKGGGFWELDREISEFTLYGESQDFGRASFDDIQKSIKNKRVFSGISQHRNFTDDFSFVYLDSNGDIIPFEN